MKRHDLVLLYRGLMLACTLGFAQTSLASEELLAIKSMLALQMGEIEKLKARSHPVGSIIQSVLGEQEFVAANGSEWTAMKGQEIPSSKLCVQFKVCKLPNASGRFLRTLGPNAAPLLTAQDDSTAVNGLAVIEHKGQKTFKGSTPKVPRLYFGGDVTQVGFVDRGQVYSGVPLTVSVSGDINHGHKLSGDSETRPDNISVTTFVKIN